MNERTTHVFAERDDEEGLYRRWVTLHPDGRLTIEGHDIGAGVEAAFGLSEYEFTRTLTADGVDALRATLGLSHAEQLIETIAARFEDSRALEEFLDQNGIPSDFWNRIGD